MRAKIAKAAPVTCTAVVPLMSTLRYVMLYPTNTKTLQRLQKWTKQNPNQTTKATPLRISMNQMPTQKTVTQILSIVQ